MAASDVPVAERSPYPSQIRSGTIMAPPPTPKSALKAPAAIPIPPSLTKRLTATQAILLWEDQETAIPDEMTGKNIDPNNATFTQGNPESTLAPILQDPEASALFFDLDGTLAPIMPAPDDVELPENTGRALASIAGRYGLVACVSGRNADGAKKIVGLDGITYIGCHGLELIPAGSNEVEISAGVEKYTPAIKAFILEHFTEYLTEAGIGLEDKGYIQVFLWRTADDQTEAEQRLRNVAQAADAAGLSTQWGRKVLEIRPPVDANKGTALTALLKNNPARFALYAGDDRTDLDAFRALRALESERKLARAICVGVSSSEGPDEISDTADLVVDGIDGIARLLYLLKAD